MPPNHHLQSYIASRQLCFVEPWGRHTLALGLPYRRRLLGHHSCVNAIALSHCDARYLVSGSDDQRLAVWDMYDSNPNQKPLQYMHGHSGIILNAVWDMFNTHTLSCGTDETILRMNVETGQCVNKWVEHDDVVQKVSYQPQSPHLFLSASADSTVKLWDGRCGTQPQGVLVGLSAFSSLAFSPVAENHFVTADQGAGLMLWDLRTAFGTTDQVLGSLAGAHHTKRLALRMYRPVCRTRGGSATMPDVSGIEFREDGRMFVCSVRKHTPLVFRTNEDTPFLEARAEHFSNKVTQKTVSFVGNNDYIASGSDDWRIYIWKLSNAVPCTSEYSHLTNAGSVVPSPHLVLQGHQSIVNSVLWNPVLPTLVSAGVERSITVWSGFCLPGMSARAERRKAFTLTELEQMQTNPSRLSNSEGDLVEASERRTLAMFDYYAQRMDSDSEADPSLHFGSDPSPSDHSDEESEQVGSEEENEETSSAEFDQTEADFLKNATLWQAQKALSRRKSGEVSAPFPELSAQSLWDMVGLQNSATLPFDLSSHEDFSSEGEEKVMSGQAWVDFQLRKTVRKRWGDRNATRAPRPVRISMSRHKRQARIEIPILDSSPSPPPKRRR
eukprot:NODE_766_length_1887_cov_20.698295_g713_i0.p1 GENE.NODE_766_length_1887_cov_20.698295_g713_i0~~NODE_766_length_1887_cov_20.698295_g713_i0.p1  ORF type:complete len:620 (+),score=135.06 NODE_766_length_1887_cov_20.698295_g713_i0:28-1860(+)